MPTLKGKGTKSRYFEGLYMVENSQAAKK